MITVYVYWEGWADTARSIQGLKYRNACVRHLKYRHQGTFTFDVRDVSGGL